MDEINQLGREIIEINRNNKWKVVVPEDWDHEYKIPAITALIMSEVSEALEAFRKNDIANFREELADIIIRTLDCAAGFGFDMDAAIRKKLEVNKKRGERHGGKRI